MLLDVIAKVPNGDLVYTKIRFFNITRGSFLWESSMSLDQGKTWRKTAALNATRRQ